MTKKMDGFTRKARIILYFLVFFGITLFLIFYNNKNNKKSSPKEALMANEINQKITTGYISFEKEKIKGTEIEINFITITTYLKPDKTKVFKAIITKDSKFFLNNNNTDIKNLKGKIEDELVVVYLNCSDILMRDENMIEAKEIKIFKTN